ncbi:hypothetical protein [Olivibacter jilunii]|uniref:hypothetical protein n=1 Tax=Olivibacter jilunii TaxID=985016 RepID=UPI0010316ADC|nr:hypothetical protein [Olivibacter jilunii]
MGWFNDIFSKDAENWLFRKLAATQTPEMRQHTIIEADGGYLSIRLKSMRIVKTRSGFNKFYPTVHSHLELSYIGSGTAKFNVVTTPTNLVELDGKNVDKVINVNRTLLDSVPYRGGNVKLEIGLFSIQEDNLASPFITLLTKMSKLGGVSFISAALPYVEPLEEGIKLLTGSDVKQKLEIGVCTELNEISTGLFVVMRANDNDVDVSKLSIKGDEFALIDRSGKPVKDYPYMVFEIAASDKRTDFFKIPDIASAYNDLRKAVQTNDFEKVKEAKNFFRVILLTSPDLLTKDAQNIFNQVDKEVNEIMNTTQVNLAPRELMPLNRVKL